MPMVFSEDVLFVDVPQTAGESVSEYLFRVLPPPVAYVSLNRQPPGAPQAVTHIPGRAHQTLPQARKFLRTQGRNLAAFPLILAVVRNPYDLAVSFYSYLRQPLLRYAILEARDAPPRPVMPVERSRDQEMEALITALPPGRVARIEPTGNERLNLLRLALYRASSRLGRPVETWDHDGQMYAALYDPAETPHDPFRTAQQMDFRSFLLRDPHDFLAKQLSRLSNFYHLNGEIPPNLRIARFEHLAEDVKAALAEVGIQGEAEFPWLNRSERDDYTRYYDAETEAVVYEEAKWLFDAGIYPRLDLAATPTR